MEIGTPNRSGQNAEREFLNANSHLRTRRSGTRETGEIDEPVPGGAARLERLSTRMASIWQPAQD
jgi:hypothetical protein